MFRSDYLRFAPQILVASLFALYTPAALAESVWDCFSPAQTNGSSLLKASGDLNTAEGVVDVSGNKQKAIYYLNGIDERWDFGFKHQFSLGIQPDGSGYYYDFSGAEQGEKVEPSQTYSCKRQTQEKIRANVELQPQDEKNTALNKSELLLKANEDPSFKVKLDRAYSEAGEFYADREIELKNIQKEAVVLLKSLQDGKHSDTVKRQIQRDIEELNDKFVEKREQLSTAVDAAAVRRANRMLRNEAPN